MSASQPRSKALLILGMHRSGTSAVTRVINLLGADLGRNILLPGQGNSEGFWEHFGAMETNHGLLHAFGHTWFDVRRLPRDWRQQTAGQEALARAKDIIRNELAPHSFVAIKDPRMCLTAPMWIEAFESFDFEVQCLLVARDPREVADSLQAREQWPREPMFALWAHYMMEAVLASRQCTRSLITYDQLLKDWRGTMQRVSSELSLAWPRDEQTAAPEVNAFLRPGHRHYVAAPHTGDEQAFGDMPSLVAQFYANCLAVADGRSDWKALDQTAALLQDAADLYTPHLDRLITEYAVEKTQLTAKAQSLETLLKTLVTKIQPKS